MIVWNLSTIIKAMVLNLTAFKLFTAQFVPTMQAHQAFDTTYFSCSIASKNFNYVLDSHYTSENVDNQIQHIKKEFESRNLSWCWIVGPLDTPHDLERHLIQASFKKLESGCGMYCKVESASLCSKPEELTFEKVLTKKQLEDFNQIHGKIRNHSQFFNQEDTLLEFLNDSNASCCLYVGYHNNIPSTTGLLYFHSDVAGIYCIATDIDYRYKGYASAMLQFLLALVQEKKCEIAVLQCWDQIKPLYKKNGFQECGEYQLFLHNSDEFYRRISK